MSGMTSKAVRKACEAASVYPDAVRKRDGAVVVRRSYFYRMGKSAEDFAARVATAVKRAGFDVDVMAEDRWAAWPRTSYFVAVVREKSAA